MESPGEDDPRPSSLTFIPSSRVALRPPPAVVLLLHPTGLEDGKFRPLKTGSHCCHSLCFGHFPLPAHWPGLSSLTIFCCSRGVPRKIRGTHTLTRAHTHARTHTHRAQCLAVAAAGDRGQEENFSRRFQREKKKWQTNSNAFRKCPHYARRRSF